jgi:hypothetical protein
MSNLIFTENLEKNEYLALETYSKECTNLGIDLECIFAYQSIGESGCFSIDGRPLTLTDKAKKHYGVSNYEEMIGKQIYIPRRKKDQTGNYIDPSVWYLQKSTIKELIDLDYGINYAATIVENIDGTIKESVRINRICLEI